MSETGDLFPAPHAQLILYPKYPEVRFSGFLKNCAGAPSEVMTVRDADRILCLGITNQGKIIGAAAFGDTALARALREARPTLQQVGVFYEIPIGSEYGNTKSRVIKELRRIHDIGWMRSKRLRSDGSETICLGANCGGFTLEAELGIRPNSMSEPDFLGWEVKTHTVTDFSRPGIGAITLMTPEPTGGFYHSHGVEAFVRKYGYADLNGREDRLNFGGVHYFGEIHVRTNLKLVLAGYDDKSGAIKDPNGGLCLMDKRGHEAAVWSFPGLMNHWRRKHARAVYVPSMKRDLAVPEYCYGDTVRMGEGTDFLTFLKAVADGKVYYDPGIKLESASSDKPKSKRRSQFRIRSAEIPALYVSMQPIHLR